MLLNKDQLSLLLYLETRLVDHSGRVDARHMNREDIECAEKWNSSGFIEFGRIITEHCNKYGSHWVTFSDDAWNAAHLERRARALRLQGKRDYMTTAEKQAG
jgi:hypothetical protein|tara:strand:+ start:181 stop:486 length:306 start_codon:yes stop_codon:yes gene_type:complete